MYWYVLCNREAHYVWGGGGGAQVEKIQKLLLNIELCYLVVKDTIKKETFKTATLNF